MGINCYLIINKESLVLYEAVVEVLKENGCTYNKLNSRTVGYSVFDIESNAISSADLVIAQLTNNDTQVYYYFGIAQALGKNVVSLVEKNTKYFDPRVQFSSIFLDYSLNPPELEKFKKSFAHFLKDFIRQPLRYTSNAQIAQRVSDTYINLNRLEPREFDNMCFELISQLGFKKVTWGREFKEIDVVATLSKKDPDGYEYQELWLITTGSRMPMEIFLDILTHQPEYLLQKVIKSYSDNDMFSRSNLRTDTPMTILFIMKEEDGMVEFFEKEIAQAETRIRQKRLFTNLRIRIWDANYVVKLIQQHKQIAYKYFTEGSKSQSKYRKTQEELYRENVTLSDELLRAKSELEEEKRKRFVAEREMAWKDVAFKAAHKLGNPVDASDTFLQSLKRRLKKKNLAEEIGIAENIDNSLEEAKSVIGQFKSLTKLEELKPKEGDLVTTIKDACKPLLEKGVTINIIVAKNIPKITADFDKLKDCFSEILANALHWFDKTDKKIDISISKATKKETPEYLDFNKTYLKIIFSDNGIGVKNDNKDKIFAPFFTTYQHGSGIGLSIVKKIIDLHGGTIFENGKLGEGAIFTILIPITRK